MTGTRASPTFSHFNINVYSRMNRLNVPGLITAASALFYASVQEFFIVLIFIFFFSIVNCVKNFKCCFFISFHYTFTPDSAL